MGLCLHGSVFKDHLENFKVRKKKHNVIFSLKQTFLTMVINLSMLFFFFITIHCFAILRSRVVQCEMVPYVMASQTGGSQPLGGVTK